MKFSKRRVMAITAAGVLATVGLTAGVCYLSGVLFLVANRSNPLQAHVLSIVSYWRLYSEDRRASCRERVSSPV